jgi:hypothetical protein
MSGSSLGATNVGRPRGNGEDQERAGSETPSVYGDLRPSLAAASSKTRHIREPWDDFLRLIPR